MASTYRAVLLSSTCTVQIAAASPGNQPCKLPHTRQPPCLRGYSGYMTQIIIINKTIYTDNVINPLTKFSRGTFNIRTVFALRPVENIRDNSFVFCRHSFWSRVSMNSTDGCICFFVLLVSFKLLVFLIIFLQKLITPSFSLIMKR